MSLDLASAFPKTNHQRLLYNLQRIGILSQIISFIKSFLTNRRTKLALPGFLSDWQEVKTGILQGSPLSPILFMLFAAELLEKLEN
jgi:Reverse transcriptase (RNA-dependent DNA polymerase)